jgi:CRP/FNR family transcriptional regulator, cyclic AMP receptor protein
VNLLRSAIQEGLRSLPDSGRLASLQRCTTLYGQGQAADAVFLIEDGLVKLTHADGSAGKIILSICGPGQMVGEESLAEEPGTYYVEAVTITPGTYYRIPRSSVLSMLRTDGELGSALVSYLLKRKLDLAKKVELLSLRDVEHRILHYLAELSGLLPQVSNGDGYQIPITQLELADLIGATRETTSTTLNQLERRGLVKLSRRLLTVPSPDLLRGAATTRAGSKNEPPHRREIAHSAGAPS